MIKRLTITAAGMAAAVVLTVGLVAAGFGPRPAQVDPAGVDPAGTELLAEPLTAVSPTAEPTLEPEVVYVKAAPTPETVVVERQMAVRNTSSSGSSAQSRPVRAVRGDDDGFEREDREDREDHEWGDD